ncbi:MAG TPA: glycosyltransferase family 9 protein [Pyrinomonadaceae bacterium]|jgi:ADP-heptose:LPS heptosyltransferase
MPESFSLKSLNPRRIAIFRALMLGDLLCAVPAFRALRRACPESEITLIGLPWARAFADRFPRYFDDFLEFPGFPGLPEIAPDVAAFPAFLVNAQSRRFDLAIQMHGSGSYVNSVTALVGARRAAGFYLAGEWLPDAATFLEYPAAETETGKFLRLTEFLGAPAGGDRLEFPLFEKDFADFDALAETRNLIPKRYVCLHPGARFPSRRWQPEKFAQVADELARAGWRTVLTGTAGERDLTAAVKSFMKTEPIDLTGQTSLGALGVLLARAALLISNDTGVSHVAAALRVPRVVVVLGSDGARWQAYNDDTHRVAAGVCPCRPWADEICPRGLPCADSVTPATVLSEAENLLSIVKNELTPERAPAATIHSSPFIYR